MEKAFDEMLGKHEGTLLKQEVNQAVLTKTKQQQQQKKSHQSIRLNGKRNYTMIRFSLVTFLTLQW